MSNNSQYGASHSNFKPSTVSPSPSPSKSNVTDNTIDKRCNNAIDESDVANSTGAIVVTALYKFTRFADYEAYRQPLQQLMLDSEVRGTVLLAYEGINGTISGNRLDIDTVLNYIQQIPAIGNVVYKESFTNSQPFYRTKVKLKKEIVTMGVADIDPLQSVGRYVKPSEWNALITDPDVVLIDTRNDYEVQIGTFKHAINPHTETFREFPEYVNQALDPNKHKKVAMFCTGGIRCEKSTAYLRQQGFDEVYHLEGGILKYLEEIPHEDSLWEGDCFVFDNRVAVNHNLQQSNYDQCYACRMPITEADKLNPAYVKGESCHHCIDKANADQRARFRERERQIQLAKKRGETHIGAQAKEDMQARKQQKQLAKHEQKE